MKTPGITTAESKNIGEKSEMLQIYVGLIELQSRTDSQINPDSLKHWFKYVLIIKWCQTFKKKSWKIKVYDKKYHGTQEH